MATWKEIFIKDSPFIGIHAIISFPQSNYKPLVTRVWKVFGVDSPSLETPAGRRTVNGAE